MGPVLHRAYSKAPSGRASTRRCVIEVAKESTAGGASFLHTLSAPRLATISTGRDGLPVEDPDRMVEHPRAAQEVVGAAVEVERLSGGDEEVGAGTIRFTST